MSHHVLRPVMLTSSVIQHVMIVALKCLILCMLIGFQMILMYLSQANKAPARVLDACLGEGVVSIMPAPPFFSSGHLAGHRSPLHTLN